MTSPGPGGGGAWPVTAPEGPAEAWVPRPYPQLLRGPRHRWWRPLASLGAGLLAALVAVAVISGVGIAYAVVRSRAGAGPTVPVDDASWGTTPEGLLVTNLILAALIPVTMAAVWAGFGWRPRWLASVEGGVRWRWLGTCALIALLVLVLPWLVLTVIGDDVTEWAPEPGWPALLATVVLTTPVQAAGEEYLFRGWLPQMIGSVIANPVAGGLVGAAVSCSLFALAHGEQNPWLFADRFAFGVVAAWLVWRTGGLEASIALHAVNNLAVFAVTIASGELDDTVTATDADPGAVVVDVVTLLVTGLVVVLVARRQGIERLFVPPRPTLPRPDPAWPAHAWLPPQPPVVPPEPVSSQPPPAPTEPRSSVPPPERTSEPPSPPEPPAPSGAPT